MYRFILRRFLLACATLLFTSLVVFLITEVLPGDPAQIMLGRRATPESLAALQAQLGLDKPLVTRYVEWLGGALQGDWGDSFTLKLPVMPLILERLQKTLVIVAIPFLVGVPLGILIGVISGLLHNRTPDLVLSVVMLVVLSIPEFVLATFLIVLFAIQLKWLPASSMMSPNADLLANAAALVMPIITLGAGVMAYNTRVVRASMIEVMSSHYIRTARAKGLANPRIIWRHALKNAILPDLPVIGLTFGYLVGGIVVVETVFAYPGLGSLLLRATTTRDIPLLQALVILLTTVYLLVNLLMDITYYVLNPQIREYSTR